MNSSWPGYTPVKIYLIRPRRVTMRIMGLDPSMSCTGIALPDRTTFTLKPKGTGDDRLVYLTDHVLLAARTARVDMVVCEDVPSRMIGAAGKVIPMLHGAIRLDLL